MIAGSPPQRRQAVLQSDRHDAARRRQARSAQPGRDAAEHASPERQGYEPRHIEDPDRAAREIRRGLGGEAEGERGDEGEIPHRKRSRDLARGLREMLEAVFVPLQRREHRQQCDERPQRSHGFDIGLNSQGEESVEGARCIGGADDRRGVDEDAEIDESNGATVSIVRRRRPRASARRRRGQPSAGCQSPATDHDPLMHCSCLSSAQPFSSGGARAALALVRRNRRAARVRGESRGAPSRIWEASRLRGRAPALSRRRRIPPHRSAGNRPGRDKPTCAAPGRAAKACGADANVRVRAALLKVTGV